MVRQEFKPQMKTKTTRTNKTTVCCLFHSCFFCRCWCTRGLQCLFANGKCELDSRSRLQKRKNLDYRWQINAQMYDPVTHGPETDLVGQGRLNCTNFPYP